MLTQLNSCEKIKSQNEVINKSTDHIDRGFELILAGGKNRKPKSFRLFFDKMISFFNKKVNIHLDFYVDVKPKNNLRRIMLAVSIVFAAFLFILFLIVGVIGGWVARDYMMNYQEVEKIHPEMYDRNGNIVPDEIVAFRFENYDNNDEEDD